jgi:hypothetical protein
MEPGGLLSKPALQMLPHAWATTACYPGGVPRSTPSYHPGTPELLK